MKQDEKKSHERELFVGLLTHIKENAAIKKGFHIATPTTFTKIEQRGENCKLVALSQAIEHANNKSKLKSRPVPLYKNKSSPASLRQFAKAHGSVVGEMYSLESLVKTSADAGYNVRTFAPFNEDEYVRQLEQLIDQNLVPIVFYELNITPGERYGYPMIGDGKNEHAGTVVAYYKNEEDETRFIINTWGQYYDYDGMELALSSFSLAQKRQVETFSKIRVPNGSTWWVLKDKAHTYAGTLLEHMPNRTALPMRENDTPLKGKIMVVDGPVPEKLKSDEFLAATLDEGAKTLHTQHQPSFFAHEKTLVTKNDMEEFLNILYNNQDSSVFDSRKISQIPHYVPSFYFLLDGARCNPTISRTEWSHKGKNYTTVDILLGKGSSKSVLEIDDKAIFLPSFNNLEMWERIIDEEIAVSKKIEQFQLGLHTQALSKATITIVDSADETRQATIPIMIAPSFNHLGRSNNSYVYDVKNNKIYGTHLPLFNHEASNLTNIEWYAALLQPLINELALCLTLKIPCYGDARSLLVKNDIGSSKPPFCHLMLYDFSFKHCERDLEIIGKKELPSAEIVSDHAKDLIKYLQLCISREECIALGIDYGFSNYVMEEFIKSNDLLPRWIENAIKYTKTTLGIDDDLCPTEEYSSLKF
jgi:hypothetical protein